jgi:hypothetical protein
MMAGKTDMHRIPLYLAFVASGQTVLEVADNQNLRLHGQGHLPKHNFDTHWRQIDTGAELESGYRPDVTVRIDAAKLREKLQG